jgi:hypothetical protein
MQTPFPSAPRSAIFPERCRLLPALSIALSGAASVWACSGSAQAVRLQALQADEEIYRITCEKSIEPCREKALEMCEGVYQVLETSGAPIAPPRITTAPGPASTGPRYARPKWVGRLVIACGDVKPGAAPNVSGPPVTDDADAPGAGPATLTPGQACIPGATQECLGAGACRGAQACLMDGRGYGPCDCGTATLPPARELAPADAGSAEAPPLSR